MIKLFLTGPDGFVGRQIYRVAADRGIQCVALPRNLTDFTFAADAPDTSLLVLSGAATPDNCEDERLLVQNSAATIARDVLLIEILRPKICVFLSSASIYGQNIAGTVDINSRPCGLSHYGAMKILAENAISAAAEKTGVSLLTLRLPGIVGLGARRIFLANWMDNIKNGIPIKIANLYSRFNNLYSVDDLAVGIIDFACRSLDQTDARREIFNLFCFDSITFSEALDCVKEGAQPYGFKLSVEQVVSSRPSFYFRENQVWPEAFRRRKVRDLLTEYTKEAVKP